ncbi:GMC family oxidoreductase N-terminal domain-containing protein [Actinocorallia sp. API 0066]|uniref:GMC family oxidoreductase n=1 Tax=Actinocorallia sp. API 0066 TaxID=2896846 RepID=UPI001E301C33|nr:GMC family oxidoreductase N-terminal domain-containing protein [Actinocorallia sp. API 0066]MCD0451812.1 GMC family oxidoreductase N-terminal domain-containing protein [Actinocorallia sp. API 0066]
MDYDYVIVGAGSSGCVLAARLTEDPSVTVALVEAGGSDAQKEFHIPAGFPQLLKGEGDWDLSTTAQEELAGRELYWPRGKVLGGSSSINAMMWVRGVRADYDGWDVPGWSYDEVLPYFHRAERRVGSNTGGVYGTEGPLHVEELRDPNVTTKAFLAACAETGLTRLPELNGEDNEGYSPTPVNQKRGRRWSAHDAYLKPALKRPNLTVITNVLVSRVVIEDGRAVGVAYGGQELRARREVVLCAGAIGSPHLLMLSGVGDPEQLAEHGIDVVAPSPSVGRHLEDHLSIAVLRTCPSKVTLASAGLAGALVSYLTRRKGPFTSNIGEAVAFLRSDPRLPAPDLELIFAPVPFVNHGLDEPAGDAVTIGVVLLQPDSQGTLSLSSADPADPPKIDAAYLTGDSDLKRLAHGVREAEKLFATEALRPYATEPYAPYEGAEDESVLEDYIRAHSETLYHPVGTCRMGVEDTSVVDPDLRVRGVEGLRVADASVLPRINRGHTHAPAILIGEKAADLLKA